MGEGMDALLSGTPAANAVAATTRPQTPKAGGMEALLAGLDQRGSVFAPLPSTYPGTGKRDSDPAAHGINVIGTGLYRGLADLIGAPQASNELMLRGMDWSLQKLAKLVGRDLTDEEVRNLTSANPQIYMARLLAEHGIRSEDVRGFFFQDLGIPEVQAETTVGRILQGGAQGVGSSIGTGGVGAAVGLAAGMGAEVAGSAVRGTSLEPYARVGGALAAGGPVGAIRSLRGRPGAVLEPVMRDVTDDQLARAAALHADAARMGTPITGLEALQQVTGPNQVAGAIQRVTEQSTKGGPGLARMMSQRPARNEAAFNREVGAVGPRVTPTEIPPRVQGAAQANVQAERDTTNALSKPAYEASVNNPQLTLRNVPQDPAIQGAIAGARNNPQKYGRLDNLPDNALPVLDAAKKYLDDAASAAARKGENFAASNLVQANKALTKAIDVEHPRYASARNIQSQRQKYVEEPLERSPTGQLASAETFDKQVSILFPKNPQTLTPAAVHRAVRNLNRTDQTAARDLTRQYLQNRFDEATRSGVGGANEFGGAKFRASIVGNTRQAANLRAAIVAQPQGIRTWNGFKRFLDVMEAQGTRRPANSATAQNTMLMDEMSSGGVMRAAAQPTRVVGEWYDRFRYGRNSAEMARILTDENSVMLLRELATTAPNTARARALAAMIVIGTANAQTDEAPQQ